MTATRDARRKRNSGELEDCDVAGKKRGMTKKQSAKTAALSKKMPKSLARKIATNSKRRS